MKSPCSGEERQTVSRMIAQIESAASRSEMCGIFSDAVEAGLVEKLNPILYRCGSCLIHDILRFSAQQWVPALKALNGKGFALFPELLKAVTLTDYCTVFLNIEGMDGKDLLPFEAARDGVDLAFKQAAYRELERLCEANLYVPWPSRGPWGWFVTAGTHRIVAPVRGNVVSMIEHPDTKREILRAYRDYLFSPQ